MSMRSLENQEMIQLSSPILTDGTRQHAALFEVPSAYANLPVMQAAHDGLVGLDSGVDTEVLVDTVHKLVGEHDVLALHLGRQLRIEIGRATSADDRAALTQARDQILPPGPSLIRRSVAVKAGEHPVRDHRVTAAALALLGTVPVRGGGTLADVYAQLQTKTLALSAADSERQAAVAAQRGPRTRDARKRWVAAVELLDRALRGAGVDPMPVLGAIRAAQTRSVPTSAPARVQPAAPVASTDATPVQPAVPATPVNGAAPH